MLTFFFFFFVFTDLCRRQAFGKATGPVVIPSLFRLYEVCTFVCRRPEKGHDKGFAEGKKKTAGKEALPVCGPVSGAFVSLLEAGKVSFPGSDVCSRPLGRARGNHRDLSVFSLAARKITSARVVPCGIWRLREFLR